MLLRRAAVAEGFGGHQLGARRAGTVAGLRVYGKRLLDQVQRQRTAAAAELPARRGGGTAGQHAVLDVLPRE